MPALKAFLDNLQFSVVRQGPARLAFIVRNNMNAGEGLLLLIPQVGKPKPQNQKDGPHRMNTEKLPTVRSHLNHDSIPHGCGLTP